MNLPLPNLDDRTYADLEEEAIAQIPLEYPEWTDHNPTDTGIILIELLAWLTEMTLYRVDRISDKNYAAFIKLLNGEESAISDDSASSQEKLQSTIQNTLLAVRDRYRAVTADDYEQLVLQDWHKSESSEALKIARVKCLSQRDLDNNNVETFAKGHISLVIVPQDNTVKNYQLLFEFLEPRQLLTTCLHIVEPEYVPVNVQGDLIIKDGYNPEDIRNKAKAEVEKFFAPLNSGKYWQGKGWSFGRSVYISELYKLLNDLEGVDYVGNLQITDRDKNSQTEISLAENQLVKLQDSEFQIVVQIGNESKTI